jgi:hypothetical protein
MDSFEPELSIKVIGKELIITLPGTNYSVTYFKPKGSFGLLAKDMVKEDDLRLPMTAGQFLAKALEARQREGRAGFGGLFKSPISIAP